jgi:hypothetical protein
MVTVATGYAVVIVCRRASWGVIPRLVSCLGRTGAVPEPATLYVQFVTEWGDLFLLALLCVGAALVFANRWPFTILPYVLLAGAFLHLILAIGSYRVLAEASARCFQKLPYAHTGSP